MGPPTSRQMSYWSYGLSTINFAGGEWPVGPTLAALSAPASMERARVCRKGFLSVTPTRASLRCKECPVIFIKAIGATAWQQRISEENQVSGWSNVGDVLKTSLADAVTRREIRSQSTPLAPKSPRSRAFQPGTTVRTTVMVSHRSTSRAIKLAPDQTSETYAKSDDRVSVKGENARGRGRPLLRMYWCSHTCSHPNSTAANTDTSAKYGSRSRDGTSRHAPRRRTWMAISARLTSYQHANCGGKVNDKCGQPLLTVVTYPTIERAA